MIPRMYPADNEAGAPEETDTRTSYGQGQAEGVCRQGVRRQTDAMTAGMGYIGVKTGLFRAMGGKAEMRAEDIARNQVGGTTRPVTSATKLRAT